MPSPRFNRAKVLRDESFQKRARGAYCNIATSAPSLYGNIILYRGVSRPE